MKFQPAARGFLAACVVAAGLAGCADRHRDMANALADIAPAANGPGLTKTVYFALGSARLTIEARHTIRAVAAIAAAEHAATVHVIGHADTVGSTAANRRLSERRAQAVAAALVANGVARDRVVVGGVGEGDLPVATADDTFEAANRVVVIKL